MSADPFATLGVEARCHFTDEELKSAYHKRAQELHPDAIHGDTAEFVHLNAAYRKLLDPPERLRALIALQHGSSAGTENKLPTKVELFDSASRILDKTAQWTSKVESAKSPVAKSALLLQRPALESELKTVSDSIESWHRSLNAQLVKLDKKPSERTIEALSALTTDYTYARRWLKRLREQSFQLTLV